MEQLRWETGRWLTSRPKKTIRPGIETLETGNETEEGGLAAAGRAQQGAKAPPGNRQTEVLQDPGAAEGFGNSFEQEQFVVGVSFDHIVVPYW